MSSDEASSGVTYTSIYSDYEEPSDVGLPRVIVYGLCVWPRGARARTAFIGLHTRTRVPRVLGPSDDEILVKGQPHAADASPIALSTGYIADSDPEEDPDDESEDGTTDYPADRGDDDDSSGDDADVEDEEEASEEDKEEEEEHLAPADSTAVSSSIDHVLSAEET
ncbi:hypothetical protein Tco_1252541 [Tanacetum coccineum]